MPDIKAKSSLSNSSISTLKQCKRKYYYDYVLRLPRTPRDYFILGTFVHAVLEDFYKLKMEDRSLKISSLMGKCFGDVRDKTPDATGTILRDAKIILQDYLTRIISRQELPPKMVLENKFNVEVEGIPVTGVIDRIDFGADNHIVIIDYKTGKRAKSEADFQEDLQLPLYALAAQKIYDVPLDKITCQLDHLRVKKIQKLHPDQATIEKAIKDIVQSNKTIVQGYESMEGDKTKWSSVGPEMVEQIKTNKEWSREFESKFIIFINKFTKYWQANPGWYCTYCDHQRICQGTNW